MLWALYFKPLLLHMMEFIKMIKYHQINEPSHTDNIPLLTDYFIWP